MPNFRIVLCYKGTRYSGFQLQPNDPSVAAVFQRALNEIFKQDVRFTAAGRTDAGVHALGQVINFNIEKEIPCDGLGRALNALLPEDVRVLGVDVVPESFSARYSAQSREYRYLFSRMLQPMHLADFVTRIKFSIDETLFSALKDSIEGTHNFASFRAVGSKDGPTERTIFSFDIQRRNQERLYELGDFEYYELRIVGKSFLYRMVRNLTGAIFEIFRNKMSVAQLREMLDSGEKRYFYTTAPAKGLCLVKVNY